MILSLFLLLGCKSEDPVKETTFDPYDVQVGPYDTNIQWTDYGIPHITGQDYGSLGYGMGYALAKDHYCVLIDQIVRIRGERSKYHGDSHLDADFGWKAYGLVKMSEDNFHKLDNDIQQMLIGYTAGYNRFREDNPEDIPSDCKDKSWIRDINHIDLLAYYLGLGLKASGENFVKEVGSAQPPNRLNQPPAPEDSTEHISPRSLEEALSSVKDPEMGSNGWAIGSDLTEEGGLLFSNTHFPYWGERRWHESHLTIPGKLDVYGASLIGVAAINIGFNQNIAWTHTVSTNPRFVVYTLELKDGEPTEYLYNDEYIKMTEHDFSVEVLQDDGSTAVVDRTLYKSKYGWMLNAPQFGWPETVGFTFRDANEGNLNMLGTWFDMNKASNIDEFIEAQRSNQGIPWVYSIATDASGEVWFADTASTPNFTDEAEEYYLETESSENPFSRIFREYGVIAVSGSNDMFAWEEQEGARSMGLIPFEESPQQRRNDYVFNANDSHWLSNVKEPLEGYSFMYGEERTPRSPRTRMNARMLEEEGTWTLERIKESSFSGRATLAEDLLADVIQRCSGVEIVEVEFEEEDQTVDIQEACSALENWDGLTKAGSESAHVWRETIGAQIFEYDDLKDEGLLYAEPFDPDNPTTTPSGLADPTEENDYLLQSMGLAVLRLEKAEIPLDALLEEVQYQVKDGEHISIMGHAEWEGGVSIAEYSGGNATLIDKEARGEVINGTSNLTEDGYHINYGNSWVAAIEITDDGPRCEAAMTYSQSANPDSDHFRDQSVLYATEEFRPCLFTTDEISAATILEVHLERD